MFGAVLAVSALVLLVCTAVFALPGLRNGIASELPNADGAVEFTMYEDKEYWLYERGGEEAEDLRCVLERDGQQTDLTLSSREPFGVVDPKHLENDEYRYVGLFVGDREGRVSVSCPDAARPIMVQPDDDALLGGGVGCCGAMTLGLIGVLIVAITSARRRRAR